MTRNPQIVTKNNIQNRKGSMQVNTTTNPFSSTNAANRVYETSSPFQRNGTKALRSSVDFFAPNLGQKTNSTSILLQRGPSFSQFMPNSSYNSNKPITYFSNRPTHIVKNAPYIHSTSVYLKPGLSLSELENCDDVPDESLVGRSSSIVNPSITPGSASHRGNMTFSYDPRFVSKAKPRSNLVLNQSMANFISVDLSDGSPLHAEQRGVGGKLKVLTEAIGTQGISNNGGKIIEKLRKLAEAAHRIHKGKLIKQLKLVAIECKVSRIAGKSKAKKKQRGSRRIKHKFTAAVLVIQRAFRLSKRLRGLRRALVPTLEMMGQSPFLNFKNFIKAYMLGWKTRKILNSYTIQNHKIHIEELNNFYTNEKERNKYLIKAKETYINTIHQALNNPNWYSEFASSKAMTEKQERVQKMRERNKRLRETKIETTEYGRSHNAREIAHNYNTTKASDQGTMSLAFDFTSAIGQKKTYEEVQEEKRRKKIEEAKQKKRTNFLKARANLKYDPVQAVEEDKIKREQQMLQTELMSENYLEVDSVAPTEQHSPKVSAKQLKLGELIEKEKQRKLTSKRTSVKDIMNSAKALQPNRPKPKISESFQKLDYLKKVPKRIDCWLDTDRKQSSMIHQSNPNLGGTMQLRKSSQNHTLGSPKGADSVQSNIEDFEEFSKAVGLKKKPKKHTVSTSNVNAGVENTLGVRLNDSGVSGESFNVLSINKSQVFIKSGFSYNSPKVGDSPKNVKESLFSNEGECLEFILDRLEVGSSYNGLTKSDKNLLREDKSMYSKLKKSKPLLEIFKLMNNVEKTNSNKNDSSQQNYDSEFEKLLAKLKDEYRSLFKKEKDNERIVTRYLNTFNILVIPIPILKLTMRY